ncbi:(2,3-dihydroxybenzoyl)adenylate synthase [Cellulosilyticum ruminicola]|uniref:(2,3-dihydroxybenzoyl)adenylate synthase n=1 Tax=Cellulosilyticum ruminicola TaxID=425254 RepID=UPI0006D0C2FE|nr:AMP-binding protein [Cellulosilyticum ruminicola]
MKSRVYDIPQITFGEKLSNLAKLYADKIAIIEKGKKYTYSELEEKVERLASGYREIGIKRDDHVLIQLPNTAGCIFTIFALAKIGAVPIMGLPSQREGDFKSIIELTKPTTYIAAENHLGFNYVEFGSKLQEKYPFIKNLVFDGISEKHYTINALCNIQAKQVTETINPQSIVFLLLSGGTTNTPKLIPRTHADYLYNAEKAALRCGMDKDTIYLTSLPIEHNFTLGNAGIMGTFLSGGSVVLSKTSSPDELLELIAKEKVTHTGMVPAVASLCMDMLEWWDEGDISSWKVLQVGGSVLEESVAKRIMETLPCKLQQTFGVAEGLVCMTKLDDKDEVILKCQGKPASELDEICIVDENGNCLKNGEYGELLTRGPYTIHGYYAAEEVNKRSFTEDGFYRTGDKATILSDGNLVVTGRITEQINRGGEKIMPIEIETYLCKHPQIKEAYVVGIPDEMYGNAVCGFVLTEDDETLELVSVNAFLNEMGIAEYKRLDHLMMVEGFPLTNVGKVNKKQLVKLAIEMIKN